MQFHLGLGTDCPANVQIKQESAQMYESHLHL